MSKAQQNPKKKPAKMDLDLPDFMDAPRPPRADKGSAAPPARSANGSAIGTVNDAGNRVNAARNSSNGNAKSGNAGNARNSGNAANSAVKRPVREQGAAPRPQPKRPAPHSAPQPRQGAYRPPTQYDYESPRTAGSAAAATRGGRRVRKTRIALLVCIALFLAVVILAIVALAGNQGGTAQALPTFHPGIAVQGVDLGGLTQSEAHVAVQTAVANDLASIAITLSADEARVTLDAEDVGATTDMEDVLVEAMNYSLSLDPKKGEDPAIYAKAYSVTVRSDLAAIEAALTEAAATFATDPVEPHMEAKLREDNRPKFTLQPGEKGRAINVEHTAPLVQSAVDSGQTRASVTPLFSDVHPTADAAFLEENTKFIAKYTTTFSNSTKDPVPNRVANIRKAADIINGCVLAPDDDWSFNGYVGLRTLEGGWLPANGISGGKEYTLQPGGGICQVSTTLYNALLCGNIKISYRKKHSIPSDYVGYGLDATVDSSGIDFQFQNDTGAPLYLFAYVTENEENSRRLDITIALYGKPLPEGVTYKTRSEIIEQIPHTDTVYTDSKSIPYGYMLTTVIAHDRIVAEAYQDKYVNGKLESSKLLDTDTYRGNPAEISVGTGNPASVSVPEGAVPATVKPRNVPSYPPAQIGTPSDTPATTDGAGTQPTG